MPDNLTEEEKQLKLSAEEAHQLIDMCQTNGWKILKENYFDVELEKCKDYLFNDKNTDPVMIRAKVMLLGFIENMLRNIEFTVKFGLENEKELMELKDKKK